jgi:hypothetical protein
MSRPRLTTHQREVLGRLTRYAGPRRRWVTLDNIGSRTACEHLVAKGYAERQVDHGPRGGELLSYRPVEISSSTVSEPHTDGVHSQP